MKIVVDTNIIYETKRRLFEGADVDAALEGCRPVHAEIVIPRVVRLEIANRFRRDFREARSNCDKAWKSLAGICPVPCGALQLPSEDEAVSAYQDALDRRLVAIGAAISAWPQAAHDRVASRAIERRRPFKDSGTGYCDALIWEGVLELLQQTAGESVLLITKNHRDFCDNDKTSLHPHLVDDLRRLGLPEDSVRICHSLDDALKEHLAPMAGIVKHVRSRLDEGYLHDAFDVLSQQNDLVVDQLRSRFPLDDGEISRFVGFEVTGAIVSELDMNAQADAPDETVWPIGKRLAYLSIPVRVLSNVQFLAGRESVLRAESTKTARILGLRWNASDVLLEATFEFELTFSYLVDWEGGKVLEWSVVGSRIEALWSNA